MNFIICRANGGQRVGANTDHSLAGQGPNKLDMPIASGFSPERLLVWLDTRDFQGHEMRAFRISGLGDAKACPRGPAVWRRETPFLPISPPWQLELPLSRH